MPDWVAGLIAALLVWWLPGEYQRLFFAGPHAIAALMAVLWLAGFGWGRYYTTIIK